MPPLERYHLFISHAWRYDADYYRLVNLLEKAPRFEWRNYSVPQHDPLETKTDRELEYALHRQIRPVNAVLIISGMYVNYREWIQYEIDVALHYDKPIIGINPRGAERIPKEVRSVADVMVGWNTASILAAIRKYAL